MIHTVHIGNIAKLSSWNADETHKCAYIAERSRARSRVCHTTISKGTTVVRKSVYTTGIRIS